MELLLLAVVRALLLQLCSTPTGPCNTTAASPSTQQIVLTLAVLFLQKMGPLELLSLVGAVLVLLLFMLNSQGASQYYSRFAFYIVSVSFTAMSFIPFYCLSPLNVKNTL
jgi:hypothetical protein